VKFFVPAKIFCPSRQRKGLFFPATGGLFFRVLHTCGALLRQWAQTNIFSYLCTHSKK
jgi:hypothetical protein